MKLSNREIYDAREPLRKLIDKLLPVTVAYEIAKLVGKFQPYLKVIEDVRMSLVRKYHNEKKDEPMEVQEGTPNYDKFQAEFGELLDQEIEVETNKIKLPKEVDGKPLQIEPSILIALEKVIDVG